MTRKSSFKILIVLLCVSGVLLVLSGFGVLPSPFGGAERLQKMTNSGEDPSGSVPAASENGKNPPEGTGGTSSGASASQPAGNASSLRDPEPSATESQAPRVLVKLPVTGNDPDALAPGGESLRQWPDTLSIPQIHQPDLAAIAAQQGRSKPLKGVTVILDATHGGEDTGAVWRKDAEAVMEKTVLLKLSEQAADVLTKLGATVVQTRTTDESFSYFSVVARAADTALVRFREEADAAGYTTELVERLRLLMGDVIRINENSDASGGRGLFGTIGTPPQLRVLYDIESQYRDILLISLSLGFDENDVSLSGSQAYFMSAGFVSDVNNSYAAGKDAATLPPNYTRIDSAGRSNLALLLKSHLSRLESKLRPVDGREAGAEKDLAVLRLSNFVSASFVPGYLSNPSDREVLTSEAGRASIAQAIANAVCQYFASPQPEG